MRHTRRKRSRRSRRMRGGQLPVPICVYSHSDFFDVLEIEMYYLSKLFKGTSQKIYVFTNVPYNKPTDLKYQEVLYDEKVLYTRRILHCIEKVTEPIFILTHENDILIEYDKDLIQKIIDKMGENKIDSVQLTHMSENPGDEIPVTDDLSLYNKKRYIFTFSVQPRIWMKESAIKVFSTPAPKNYIGAENGNVQKYIKNNQKTYVVHSKTPMNSTEFLVTNAYVTFHAVRSGHFMSYQENNDLHPTIKKEHEYAYNTWMLASARPKRAKNRAMEFPLEPA